MSKILVKRIDGVLSVYFDGIRLTEAQLEESRIKALACKCTRCVQCIINFLVTPVSGE